MQLASCCVVPIACAHPTCPGELFHASALAQWRTQDEKARASKCPPKESIARLCVYVCARPFVLSRVVVVVAVAAAAADRVGELPQDREVAESAILIAQFECSCRRFAARRQRRRLARTIQKSFAHTFLHSLGCVHRTLESVFVHASTRARKSREIESNPKTRLAGCSGAYQLSSYASC